MNRVDRLMGYLLMFQSRGLIRAQDFAQRFEISERTVYRDIQALSEVGVPISAMPGEGYRLLEGYYLPPITFTQEEARALFLAVSMLDGFTEDGPTKTAVTTALDKIRTILPNRTRHQAEALTAVMHFYAYPAPPINFDDATFVSLLEAIHQNRVVHLRYHAQSSNEITERDIEPIEFVLLDKAWILQAYCRLRQGLRVFRLDRIDALQVTSETFKPIHQSINTPTPGTIQATVHFQKEIVRWVRERQHFSFQAERPCENGDVIMIYAPPSPAQLLTWLLQWGSQMELLAPEDWRQQLYTIALAMTQNHQ